MYLTLKYYGQAKIYPELETLNLSGNTFDYAF